MITPNLLILALTATSASLAFCLLKMHYQPNISRLLSLIDQTMQDKHYFFYDLNGKKSCFSKNISSMLGIKPQADFTTLQSFTKLADYQNLEKFITEHLLQQKAPLTIEILLPSKEKRMFRCSYNQLILHPRKLLGLIICFDDVTENIAVIDKLNVSNEKLQLEVKKLYNILDKLPFPIWQRDELLNIIYFNFAYSSIISQKEEPEFNRLALEINQKSRELASLASQEKALKNEEIYVIKNGQRCLFNICEIDGTLGFAVDVSAKEKIKHELDRYICAQSDLLESSASAMAIFSSDTRIKYYNQAFVKLWRLDEKWLNSKPTYGQILEELREKRKLPEQVNFAEFKKNHLKFFTELLTPHNEFFYLPDGTALRVLVIAHALGGLLFAYEDMTDHLALERSYNILIAVQKATIDALQEGIAVYGADGKLKICNPGYIKICQLNADFIDASPHITEVVNLGKDFYHDDAWEKAKLNLIKTINERQASETILERKNGTILKMRVAPLPDGALLMTYLDITDSALLERSLMQHNQVLLDADRSKTEFLANISYELRSPLTSVLGFSEILIKECFGTLNEKQQEYVLAIHHASQYVVTLVNDILDIASLEAGYMELELCRFDIYQAILEVLATVKMRMQEAQINFSLNCFPYVGTMVGDEKRFKQLLLKLLSNAIKFNKAAGTIILNVSEDDAGKISLSVEDSGIGICKEEQQLVFDKFYRNETHKIGKSGVGLGLSIVKSFVELHNGTVLIDPERKIGAKITCIFDRENPDLLAKFDEKAVIVLAKSLPSNNNKKPQETKPAKKSKNSITPNLIPEEYI